MFKKIKEYAAEGLVGCIIIGGLVYSSTTAYESLFLAKRLETRLEKHQESVEKTLVSVNDNLKTMRLIFAKDKLKKGELSQEELDQLWSKLEDGERTIDSELRKLADTKMHKPILKQQFGGVHLLNSTTQDIFNGSKEQTEQTHTGSKR